MAEDPIQYVKRRDFLLREHIDPRPQSFLGFVDLEGFHQFDDVSAQRERAVLNTRGDPRLAEAENISGGGGFTTVNLFNLEKYRNWRIELEYVWCEHDDTTGRVLTLNLACLEHTGVAGATRYMPLVTARTVTNGIRTCLWPATETTNPEEFMAPPGRLIMDLTGDYTWPVGTSRALQNLQLVVTALANLKTIQIWAKFNVLKDTTGGHQPYTGQEFLLD